MSVEPSDAASFERSQRLNERRKEVEDAKNSLILEKNKLDLEREKMVQSERDKTSDTLVKISEEGELAAKNLRKLNTERATTFSKSTQQSFENLAKNTAEELRRLDEKSKKSVSDLHLSMQEKLHFVDNQADDPFYRMKSLPIEVSDEGGAYRITIPMAEHEAKNLLVSTSNKTLNFTLARSFSNSEQMDPETKLRTSNYQTIKQSIDLPTLFDARSMHREYADGVVTLTVPKF